MRAPFFRHSVFSVGPNTVGIGLWEKAIVLCDFLLLIQIKKPTTHMPSQNIDKTCKAHSATLLACETHFVAPFSTEPGASIP